MKKINVKTGIAIFLMVTSVFLIATTQNFGDDAMREMIVSFDDFDSRVSANIQDMDLNVIKQYDLIPAVSVEVSESMIPSLESQPGVQAVEESQTYFPSVVPNDPDYNELWGMDMIEAPAAWDVRTDASSILVAVIDTGVQIDHPDLQDNIYTNPGEVAGDGVDNDGNGYVDDVNGWDFANNDNSVYDSTDDSHGTHVAGTIGGVGNNGIGVAGASWDVQILPLKFLGSQGGSTTDAISAIEYATAMGADIISASWGGGGYSDALKSAIDNFDNLFVAAAGNDGVDNDANAHYPSSYSSDNILAIASSTSSDGMSSFSNYGATSVDMAAPGSNIYSTWPGSSYNSISGTSMATPHVSGAAALVLADDPTLSATQLKAKMMDYGDPVSAFDGTTVSGNRLNLYQSLTGTAPPPPPPSTTETFTGTVSSSSEDQVHYFDVPDTGDISAELSWSTSADIDMYLYGPGDDVYSSSNYLVRAYTTSNPETMSHSASETGQFAVRVNHYSGSSTSYTLEVTHPGDGSSGGDTEDPSQVTGLSATGVSTSQIDLSWNAASDNVGVDHYNVYRDGSFIDSTSSTSYSDTGLAEATSYSYTVSAVDAAGNEGAQSSSASATTDSGSSGPITETFTGTVSDSSDEVFYFDVESSGDIDAVLSWSGSADLDFYLYAPGSDPNGGNWVDRAYTLNNPESVSYSASSTGTWAIRVSLYSGGSTSFSLEVTYPGSGGGSSGPVTDNFSGTVSSSSDEVFQFNVGSSGDIEITMSWSGSADLDFYLYAPGSDPNGGDWVDRAYTTSNPESLTYSASSTGSWSVRVNLYSGSSTSFSLTVTHPA